jgi:hypothetical protein
MWEDLWERYVLQYKIRIVLGIIILFFVSMFESCQELRYMMFSKTIDADAVITFVETGPNTRERELTGFTYTDGDAYRKHTIEPIFWPDSNGTAVKIQYIPGKEFDSRILGEHNTVWVVIFFISVVAAIAGFCWLARDG